MKQQTKLSPEQQHVETHQSQPQIGQDFSTAEELLRFDAAQTSVPPQVVERLEKSVSGLAPSAPPAGWFKRIFS